MTRYLVYRFVLSAALVPVAVSHDLAENKRVDHAGDERHGCSSYGGLAGALSAALTPSPPTNIKQGQSTFCTNLVYQSES